MNKEKLMEEVITVGKDKPVAKDTTVRKVKSPTTGFERPPVVFALPTYRTPLLTSELLYTAVEMGLYKDCMFAVLLETSDPDIQYYMRMIKSLNERGLHVTYMLTTGMSYTAPINRLAMTVDTDALCVIDSFHLPYVSNMSMAEAVKKWLESSPQVMKLGLFGEDLYEYPIISTPMIDIVGYMFHPLAIGRKEAERWMVQLASGIKVASTFPKSSVLESKTDGIEIVGYSSDNDQRWVGSVLNDVYGSEVERLSGFLLR